MKREMLALIMKFMRCLHLVDWSELSSSTGALTHLKREQKRAICLPLNTLGGEKRVIYIGVSGRLFSAELNNEFVSASGRPSQLGGHVLQREQNSFHTCPLSGPSGLGGELILFQERLSGVGCVGAGVGRSRSFSFCSLCLSVLRTLSVSGTGYRSGGTQALSKVPASESPHAGFPWSWGC